METSLNIAVREITHEDIPLLTQYWADASPAYLRGMGVDVAKRPTKEGMYQFLQKQIESPYQTKEAYALIWLLDSEAIGHTNVNKILYGKEAYMHLHVWKPELRRQGMGTALVRKSIPFFFENLQLSDLYCEPYALNPAPHKTIEKVGFEFVKSYLTIPGPINFEQEVLRWHLSKERYKTLGLVQASR